MPRPGFVLFTAAAAALSCFPLLPKTLPVRQTEKESPSMLTPSASLFRHFWEQMFGSGHANLAMRANYQNDLVRVKKITDFRYVRFHDIFQDDNGVYQENAQGKPGL